jgi:hypothetical protein
MRFQAWKSSPGVQIARKALTVTQGLNLTIDARPRGLHMELACPDHSNWSVWLRFGKET